jgi:hypothetical protein
MSYLVNSTLHIRVSPNANWASHNLAFAQFVALSTEEASALGMNEAQNLNGFQIAKFGNGDWRAWIVLYPQTTSAPEVGILADRCAVRVTRNS